MLNRPFGHRESKSASYEAAAIFVNLKNDLKF